MTNVAVLGSTSLVAASLQPQLSQSYRVIPFSRAGARPPVSDRIPFWVSLIPIVALSEWYPLIERYEPRRIVVLSSTSIFTKSSSSDEGERTTMLQFVEAEKKLAQWASARAVDFVILRPTLIYGRGLDRNVTQIANLIRRLGVFPICGSASGRRQPIHVDDVASACKSALEAPHAAGRSYNISGGETLTYKDMVARIFEALGKRPRFFETPLWLFQLAGPIVRVVPKFHDWSPSMAQRMNQDLIFDHSDAERDLDLEFRPFHVRVEDITRA